MYYITRKSNGDWLCAVTIQDGTERWEKKTRKEAVESVISGARVLNHSYIHEDDINISEEVPLSPERKITEEDWKLLQDIKRRAKIVLEHNDYRIKYRITQKEADLIIDIREGKKKVI